jgi:MarR family transcriptional regulator, organic hydroperoxide resistance regulator
VKVSAFMVGTAGDSDGMNEIATPFKVWLRFLRLHQKVQSLGAQTLRPLGLSVPQFDVLSSLFDREGMSQSELAQRLFVTKGNVSGLIDRLVEAGLVERRAAPDDRRSHALYLTPEGQTLIAQAMALQQSNVEGTLGAMSGEELQQLHRLLGIWREAVRARM